MQNPILILHLEDDPLDAELVFDQLQQHAFVCEVRLAKNRAEFERALSEGAFDVVLSDFSLPDFDGMNALLQVRAKWPDTPFILISGTLGEEQAVECMIRGATDYVLKQRLSRLVPAVSRALEAACDRTKRREAEDALKTSETEFRTMFEMASIGMAQADPNTGRFLRVNQKLCSISGYSADELLQRRFSDITHPDDRQLDLEIFARLSGGLQSEYRIEKRYVCKNGSIAWVCVNARMLLDASGKPLRSIATVEDITANKLIAESNARLAMAVDQAAEAVVITDADTRILYTNPAFETTTGYTRQEALGQTPFLLKSGKQDDAFYEKMWAKLNAKQVWSGHMVNRRKDGTLYEEEATISPVVDASGKTVNFVAVKRDVTHEVTLEAQNREAARMEAIGLLAGGVAHDFNNQLTIILHCATMLTRALPPAHPQQEDLQDILLAVQRSTELTRQLLAFSRKQTIEPVLLDINGAIGDSLKMLNRLVGENIRLTFEKDPSIGQIFMDPFQLDQILANLTINARDAIAHRHPDDGPHAPGRRLPEPGGLCAAGRLRGAHVQRRRGGHTGGDSSADLRAVLHHEGCRKGHGAGAGHGLRHRQAEQRRHRGPEHPGQRHHVHDLSAALRRAGRNGQGAVRAGDARRQGNPSGGRGRACRAAAGEPPAHAQGLHGPGSEFTAHRPAGERPVSGDHPPPPDRRHHARNERQGSGGAASAAPPRSPRAVHVGLFGGYHGEPRAPSVRLAGASKTDRRGETRRAHPRRSEQTRCRFGGRVRRRGRRRAGSR